MNRAVWRLARRDALRAPGRTALVVAMIALPTLVIVAVAVLWHGDRDDPRATAGWRLGAADARVIGVARGPVEQDPDALGAYDPSGGPPGAPWTAAQVRDRLTARLGGGVRVLPVASGGTADVGTPRGTVRAGVVEADLGDPLARGLAEIMAGRAPAGPGEIAVGPVLRDRGVRLGQTVTVGGTPRTVTGFVALPRGGGTVLGGAPGTLPLREPAQPGWLVDAPRAVTWDDVRALNADGLGVLSRAVVADPPAGVALARTEGTGAEAAVVGLVVAMMALQVVLLSGPAFAVSVRRRRRDLALVAAAGGTPRTLRAITLVTGLLLGGLAALAGGAAGIGAAAVVRPLLAEPGVLAPPFGVPWLQVALTVLLATASGVAAAYLPARQAARTDVVAALSGRPDPARPRRGAPIVGAALVVAGLVASVTLTRDQAEWGAVIGAIGVILGTVLLVPAVIALTGRIAVPLPPPLRIAVRDAARNRARSAPTVAAIMAAIAAVTALAIGGASDLEQDRREYVPQAVAGTTLVRTSAGREAEAVRGIAAELPGVPVVPLPVLQNGGECPEARCPSAVLRVGSGANGQALPAYVGGAREARLIVGRDDPAVAAALGAGQIVLFDRPENGPVPVQAEIYDGGPPRIAARLPARAVPVAAPALALVPPEVARAANLPVQRGLLGIDRADHRVTRAEQGRLTERLNTTVHVERGYRKAPTPLYLLAAAGAVLVLGATLIATRLAAVDARPERTVLAALGARPGTRRLLAMAQAASVAALGCWLGLATGFVPGLAVTRPLTAMTQVDGAPAHGTIVDVPWLLLAALAFAVPAVAALVAGLFPGDRKAAV
ncbi:FtsX-like permease family protein [Actinomadura flavalba]|uniref:FtsX-like permease family protein n=1 Tax=Actinomadura flavalba TaxID=1120938 RepID=UPI00036DB863|nr:FtsX-like permease family protein [Actinomadura flavalba]